MVLEKVEAYCRKNNLSISAFEAKCGLSNGTVGGWKRKGYKPSLSTVQKIADATKTSVAKWIG